MTDQHVLDKIWRTLGTWGRYQRIQMGLQMATYGSEALQLMIIVFIGYRPSYHCADLGNTTSLYDTVSNVTLTPLYQACHVDILINGTNTTLMKLSSCPAGYTYDLEKDRTFVTEWDLVCKGAERAEVSQMLLMVGQMIGAAILPQLSDRFGRKLVLVTSHMALFATGVTASLAPTFIVFAIMRFMCGVSQQGVTMTRTVMTLELLPAEARYMTEVLGVTFWTCGIIVIAPVAYLLRNLSWRYLYLIMSMYSAYSLFGYWLYDESVRWLLANGKIKEAKTILKKAAKMNKVNESDILRILDNVSSSQPMILKHGDCGDTQDNEDGGGIEDIQVSARFALPKYTLLTLFTRRRVSIITVIMSYTWAVNSLTYYGLTLSSASLPLDRYLSFLLLSIAEYPVAIIEYFTLNRFGRKRICNMFHALAAVSLIAGTLANYFSETDGAKIALMIFYFLGKLGITGSFSAIYLLTPELYPTNLRNVGIGFSSAVGRIGGMLAPFAGPLAERVSWAPGAIFGIMCLTVTLLLPLLSETTGRELPTTVEELDHWYRHRSGRKRKEKVDTPF